MRRCCPTWTDTGRTSSSRAASTGSSWRPIRRTRRRAAARTGDRRTAARVRTSHAAAQALDAFRTRHAICNVLHGAPATFSEDLAAAFCRAINDWVAREWLDKDDRLRASIVVPMHSPELAAKEVERVAADRRFVQVLVWEMQEIPLGRRIHWPLYRVAEQLDLPIGIHAGSSYRHPPTNLGWPSYYLEDYVSWSTGFAGSPNSLI